MQNEWNRLLWAIEFSSPRERPMLIGRTWDYGPKHHADEPSRALLFTTRRAARGWCAREHAQYAGRTDYCADWRFRPVRVRETVRRVR